MVPRAATLVVVVVLGGCHLLLPFQRSQTEPRRDGAADATARPDGGPRWDPGTKPIQVDLCVTHSAPGLPPGSCAEAALSPPCGTPECCGGCDSLPDWRDPWPGRCNDLFVFAPLCDLAGWNADGGVGVSPAGRLSFSPPPNSVTAAKLLVPEGVAPEDLVEVRLQPAWAREWKLRLAVLPSTRGCVLANKHNATGLTLTAQPSTSPSLDFGSVSATWLVLQSYVKDGIHVCRLFDDQAFLGQQTVPATLPAGPSIELWLQDFNTVAGEDVKLDYVRVFHP